MADFGSSEWIDEVNERLLHADDTAVGPRPERAVRVVLEVSDAPSSVPHALTVTIAPTTTTVSAGDHLDADCVVRIAYTDVARLVAGELDGSDALREGLLKVRGDVTALTSLGAWISALRSGAAKSTPST